MSTQELFQKAYYARRLLEHGALRYCDFREITGWPPEVCEATLKHLRQKGIANDFSGLWRLC